MTLGKFAASSRAFVIGSNLPTFLALILLAQLVEQATVPQAYRDAKPGGQVAILGGVALLGALPRA